MSRIINWVAALAAVISLVTVFTPALWAVGHTQALTNVLLGQFAAMSIGHTAYRLVSGKRPSLRSAVVGTLCGVGIAISPILLELVTGFTTVNMASGALIAAVGLYGVITNLTSEEEQRIPDLSAEQSPDEGPQAA
jgi:hypothetical protein